MHVGRRACRPASLLPPRRHPSDAGTETATSDAPAEAEVHDTKLTDDELAHWLREGCGPIEEVTERSELPLDVEVTAIPGVASTVFPSQLQGTMVVERDGELWLSSADGRRRRRLVRRASPRDARVRASWSPKGDAIAFVTGHGDVEGRLVLLGPKCDWARVLGRVSSPGGDFTRPRFSSDGRFVDQGDLTFDLQSGQHSTRTSCATGTAFADGKRCFVQTDDSPGGLGTHVIESATDRRLDIERPKRGSLEPRGVDAIAATRDGTTVYAAVRFKGFQLLQPGDVLTRYDWTPIYRIRLPSSFPPKASEPLPFVYFTPGGTSVRATSLELSPDESQLLVLQEHEPGLHATRLADVWWIHLANGKTSALSIDHGLVGLNSWIHDAKWSPDGKHALLTVEICTAGRRPDDFDPCEVPKFEIFVADEKRVGFVTGGRLPAWTGADAIEP